MSKWKCEICNTEFENFEARGFNNIIYCPLCYYKKLYNQQKEIIDKIKEYCNHKLEMLELQKRNIMQILTPENGYLKADIEIEMQKYKDILELLEETK